MAKFNRVPQWAYVVRPPQISEDKAVMMICVIKSNRDTGDIDKQIQKDYPLVLSTNPEIMKVIATLKENDIIYMKSVLVSRNVRKGSTCPACGKEEIHDGLLIYEEPIYIRKIQSCESTAEAVQYISDCREISNELTVIGNLCNEPKKIITVNHVTICEYQIAIPRTYYIQDGQDNKTDYIWVKSFGDNAINDLKRLRTGSTVLIDGYIHAKRITYEETCKECKHTYTWHEGIMEIIPYSVEYLKNYTTDEEIQALEN